MGEKKTGGAKHSADYRAKQKAEAEKLGIEDVTITMPAGSRRRSLPRSSATATGRCKNYGRTWLCRGLHRTMGSALVD